MQGNGSCKLRNVEAGERAVGEVSPVTQFILLQRSGVERHLLGNKDEPRGRGKKSRSREAAMLVRQRQIACDQAREQNAAAACFYLDFTARKEQSSTSVLGALIKQVVRGLEGVLGEIMRAYLYENQEKVIGERGLQLADLGKILQIAFSGKRTFVCMALGTTACQEIESNFFDSLN